MRLALIALALTLPAVSSAEAPPPPARPSAETAALPRAAGRLVPSRICRDALRPRNTRSPEASRLRRLGELPSGDLTLAVVNQVGECMEPVVVRQGVGGFDGGPGR